MKSLFKSLRLINAGFLLGIAFTCWALGEADEKENEEPYTPSDKFNDIYNHYKNKETANA